MLKSVEPLNVARNMVFTDVIKLGCVHTELGWALDPMAGFHKDRHLEIPRYTQRKGHVTMEAGTRAAQPKAQDTLDSQLPPETGLGDRCSFSRAFRRHRTLWTP